MVALFAVLSLMTAAFTITALRQHLMAQVDDQLTAALNLPPRYDNRVDQPRGPGTDQLEVQLTASTANGFAQTQGRQVALTDAQLDMIAAAGLGPGGRAIDLGGTLGHYRVMARSVTFTNEDRTIRIPGTRVVGLSTGPTDATIARMLLLALSSVAAGVIIAGALGTWIVRRNLEPLRRVAATATRVSQLPLHTGHVALAERVAPEDTDVRTEVGQVGAAFNEMLDHVDEALNARHRSEQRVRQFVADASHELRTPLASIKGYAELSRREPDAVPESVTHAMGRIESEASRMGSLVEDLLLLARLDAGRPLEPEAGRPVDARRQRRQRRARGIPRPRWDLDLPPEPIEVHGDTGAPPPGRRQPLGQRTHAHPRRHPRDHLRAPRGRLGPDCRAGQRPRGSGGPSTERLREVRPRRQRTHPSGGQHGSRAVDRRRRHSRARRTRRADQPSWRHDLRPADPRQLTSTHPRAKVGAQRPHSLGRQIRRMETLNADTAPPPVSSAAPEEPRLRGRRGHGARWWRGHESDPAWARPALLGLLLATLVLYTWNLTASGWANAFYSAAAQAGSESWSALFFGSSDAANSITVDKPPRPCG